MSVHVTSPVSDGSDHRSSDYHSDSDDTSVADTASIPDLSSSSSDDHSDSSSSDDHSDVPVLVPSSDAYSDSSDDHSDSSDDPSDPDDEKCSAMLHGVRVALGRLQRVARLVQHVQAAGSSSSRDDHPDSGTDSIFDGVIDDYSFDSHACLGGYFTGVYDNVEPPILYPGPNDTLVSVHVTSPVSDGSDHRSSDYHFDSDDTSVADTASIPDLSSSSSDDHSDSSSSDDHSDVCPSAVPVLVPSFDDYSDSSDDPSDPDDEKWSATKHWRSQRMIQRISKRKFGAGIDHDDDSCDEAIVVSGFNPRPLPGKSDDDDKTDLSSSSSDDHSNSDGTSVAVSISDLSSSSSDGLPVVTDDSNSGGFSFDPSPSDNRTGDMPVCNCVPLT